MKLKLYTDLSLLNEGFPVEVLIPFIGTYNKEDEPGSVMYGRFDDFLKTGKNFIELTNIAECDACLLPINYNFRSNQRPFVEPIEAFLKKVEKANKKLIIFAGHDAPVYDVPIKNAIIFNNSISKSKKAGNVYAWPHFFEDFMERYNIVDVNPRNKSEKPTIGFCGYAPPLNIINGKEKLISSIKLIANYLGLIQKFPEKVSHSYRARAIIGLKKSNKVNLNLSLKRHFAFGPQGQLNTGNTNETNTDFRINFINNILQNDYTLCVRGIGNNSIRFYESLCCGRIPVFVNTDCTLPFENFIDWKQLCVWVEEKDIDRIGDIVQIFHNNISDREFIDLQMKLRLIWVEYLSPVGFFKNLKNFLD